MPLYAGIDGVRKEIKFLYAGVDGTARQLTSFLAGIDGVRKELLSKPTTLYYWKKYNAVATTTTENTGRAKYNYIITGDIASGNEEEDNQIVYLTQDEFYAWTSDNGEFGETYVFIESGVDSEKLIFVEWETTTTTTYSQGTTHIECVYDTNSNAFPENGYQDGNWYVKTSGICDACLGGGGNEGGGGTGGDDCQHDTQTKHYEDYSSTQHKYWYVCDECGTTTTSGTEAHGNAQVQAGTCSQCGQPIWRSYCPQCYHVFSETCSCGANAIKID